MRGTHESIQKSKRMNSIESKKENFQGICLRFISISFKSIDMDSPDSNASSPLKYDEDTSPYDMHSFPSPTSTIQSECEKTSFFDVELKQALQDGDESKIKSLLFETFSNLDALMDAFTYVSFY